MCDVVKYGIQIQNRVFVGGVAFDTKEEELKEFFSQYGKIKECKIIKDNQGISRGFAFVTFECKHDAIQVQQLGTVFFNQKKLNLGPAIRQKGVVFNGAKEVENEPVLSTGVYIHPSGYSYTVAPNGVWYFHNADGTPPAHTPGSPPMSYSSNIVQKIQGAALEQTRRSSTGDLSSTGSISPSTIVDNSHPLGVPIYHNEMPQMQTTQILTHTPYQGTGFVHHTHSSMGSPNIHVAFQNMSISSHPNNGIPSTHQIQMASGPPGPANGHIHHQVNSGLTPAGPGPTVHYSRMTEMYVPYYPNHGKVSSPSCVHGHVDVQATEMNGHRHYSVPLQRPEYHTMVPSMNHVKDAYIYPICSDPHRPAYIYPHTEQNGFHLNEAPTGFYKRVIARPQVVSKSHVGPGCFHKDPAIVKCSAVNSAH